MHPESMSTLPICSIHCKSVTIMHQSILFIVPLLTTGTAFLLSPPSVSHIPDTRHKSSALHAKKKDDGRSSPSAAKLSALEGVLSRIERNYGRGSITKLGEADRMVVDCFGSGSMTLGKFYFCCVMCGCFNECVYCIGYLIFCSRLLDCNT